MLFTKAVIPAGGQRREFLPPKPIFITGWGPTGNVLILFLRPAEVRLQIAGDGPMRQQLELLAQGLYLQNVSFLGHVSGGALEKRIADAQFTIFPSRAYETFGKSILESYAQGRAVIASDLGSRREVVEEGETGIFYRAKDVDQLAAAISYFFGRFSPEKNCHLLIEAFEQTPTKLKLVLAGGSSHTDDYIARLRQHESDAIMFLDWLSGDALDDVITNAALFVLPSDMEGMSLALLDAMGAG